MGGLKPSFLDFMHYMDLHGIKPELKYKLEVIYKRLEDVYDVGSMTELQEAVDSIGVGAGTIFITAGTHVVDTPIDIDGGSSLVIYGHGNNTVLEAVDGVNVFNITNCASLLVKTLRIDATNYSGATSSVIVNETNDNVVVFEDVSIIGNNFGVGIELISNNCLIEHCNISQLNDGIYINNSIRQIITQNIVSNNARYGINLDTSLYSNIDNNTCNSNLTGIYVNNSTNNSISNNICNLNTENGIYITNSSYNTISGNTCENNDSNTANDQAGMFITNNSDFNTISGNSLNNNNNIGIGGTGYGLIIATNTCEENVVAANNANGNDIDWKDAGLRTTIKYYVQTEEELQDAIDSIGTGAGTIVITIGVLTLSATINVDGGGFYIIEGEGEGTVIDCGADRTAFNITSAVAGTTLRNFKIDANNLTSLLKEIINVNEGSNNKIVCENLTITGDGLHGLGVFLNSDNCLVTNCFFEQIKAGVFMSNSANNIIAENICQNNDNGINNYFGSDCIITGNVCSNNTIGIFNDRSTNSTIVENTCNHNDRYGIFNYGSSDCTITGNACNGNNTDDVSDGAGIQLTDDCDYNTVVGNSCNNNANTGAGTAYGINVNTVDCNSNIIGANSTQNNDNDYNDNGTGTVRLADDTVYGISWDTNLGTATKNAIYDKIQLVIAGAVADAFKTITGITNDVVADGVADTLTLAAVGGLTIVGTAVTDTITFTNTITQYTDVMVQNVITAELVNGQSIDNRIDALLTANADGYVDDAGAIAAVLADDKYIKNYENDGTTGDLTVANLITAGLVDGVDVGDLKTDVDGFNDELKLLTQVEIQQLENIGAELISAAEWGFVASLQDVASGASPTFNRITINNVGTVNSDAVRYDQLTSMVGGLNWQEAVLDNDLNAPPGGEGVGDRYIVAAGGAGAWAGHDDDIAEYNGVGWDFTNPVEGFTVWVLDEDTNFTYNGVAWVEFGSTVSHNNTSGLQGGVAGEYFHLTNAQHGALHARYTDAEVRTIIDAEIVDGQSIDNAIDALLTANADGYQDQAGVEAIIDAEIVGGQSIDNAIDALINAHNVADNHIAHSGVTITAGVGLSGGGTIAANRTIDCDITQYTDVMVQNVITAELVDGQSIDNRIDALIAGLVDAAGAVAAVEAAGLDFDTTKTLGFVDDAVGVFIDRIYDEDDMASDDEHGLATQQSIKKYNDNRLYDIGFSHNWGGIVDKSPTVDKVYDQFIEVANEMTAIKYCLNFQGVWNATLGAAPHAAPADGDYWIVTTAGNWDGIDWELLDWIVWEDNSKKWYKVKYFRQLPKVIVKATDSIQTAIDKVIYMGGGTVEIQSATFNDANDAFPLNINDAGAGLFLRIVGIGTSTIIDPNGDTKIFNITNIGNLVLEDFKIDIRDYVTAALECIDISEANDNLVIINNITILGDGTNGYGIEVNSNNCKINECNISSVNIGINVSGNDNTIQENVITSCNTYGIQIKGNKNSIYNNETDNNSVGIYLDTADYNQINGNYIEGNTLNGIYLTGSNYNAINDNYSIGNDSNTANPQAGIVIDADSDNNTIISNTSIDNNNIGAGNSYGVLINNANCNKNILDVNKCSGNDVQYWDLGTNTDMVYRCSTEQEIQDAIDSIGSKAGTIKILMGTITISATIDVDGGGSYMFEGEGDSSILQITAINSHIINITNALNVRFTNIKFDLTNHSGNTPPNYKAGIYIDETNDNWVIIDNCAFYYNGALPYEKVPFGVIAVSDNITIVNSFYHGVQFGVHFRGSYGVVSNCLLKGRFGVVFSTTSNRCICSNNSIIASTVGAISSVGISINGSYNNIIGNNIYDCRVDGIDLSDAYYCIVSDNIINDISSDMVSDRGGIWIVNNSSYNLISNNLIKSVTNIGAGVGYGIFVNGATEVGNRLSHNVIINCDGTVKDNGAGTIIEYCVQNSAELQNAIDSIGTKAGTINLDASFTVATTIDIDANGSYIIKGEGDNTVLTTVGDIKCFNITSALSVLLQNFKIDASSLTTTTTRVIDVSEGSDNKVIVDNITVIGDGSNGLGIYLGSDNCIVKNCWIQDVYRGIYLDSVSYCKIIENTCYSIDNRGIYLSASNYNVIKGNNSHDNSRDGIYLVGSSNNAIVGNVLNDNTFVGIYLYSASNYNNITGNTCDSNDEEGIYIRTSHNNNISVNVCCANGTCGIWLNDSGNNTITGNTCNDNDLNDANVFGGIYISGNSDQNAINGNVCNNNNNIGAGTGHGIRITDNTCDDNTVMGNIALGNDTNYVDNGTNTFDTTVTDGDPLNNFVAGAG